MEPEIQTGKHTFSLVILNGTKLVKICRLGFDQLQQHPYDFYVKIFTECRFAPSYTEP